ncbi:MAG: hypothetical protein ABJC13_09470 [Acidobacteriota bacterium]
MKPNPKNPATNGSRDWRRLNAFARSFLAFIDLLDESPHADQEVEWSGPWEVRFAATARTWGVARLQAEEPEEDPRSPNGSPLEFDTRERALLAAAILPIHGRDPLFVEQERAGPGVDLAAQRPDGTFGVVGWSRHSDPDLFRALHVVEGLTRSPRSLALVLEAAGPGGIRATGLYLARRLAARVRENLGQTTNG